MLGITDGKGGSKAAVPRSQSNPAPSYAAVKVPPPSTGRLTRRTFDRNRPAVDCGRDRPYSSCIPNPSRKQANETGIYKRRP